MENTSSPITYRIAAGILAVAAVIVVVLFAKHGGEGTTGNVATTTSATNTITQLPTKDNPVIKGNGYTISLDNGPQLPPAPNYKIPIVFGSDIAPEVRIALQKNADILIARIDKDKTDLRSWIDLGTTHKQGGDYKAAATFWTYVSKAAPNNTIAFENLADLYQNFLKDYGKAEANWKAAIKVDPKDTNTYHSLSDLYNDLEKKPAAAEAILTQGIQANPNSIDLHVVLARLYKAQSRAADAEAQYKLAIQAAKDAGQSDVAKAIQTEAGL